MLSPATSLPPRRIRPHEGSLKVVEGCWSTAAPLRSVDGEDVRLVVECPNDRSRRRSSSDAAGEDPSGRG